MKILSPMLPCAALVLALSVLQADAGSLIPIETRDAGFGKIASARTHRTGPDLFVAGTVLRNTQSVLPSGAHVDVQLVGADNALLAEKYDDIDPPTSRKRGAHAKKSTFVAKFGPAESTGAQSVRIILHAASHKIHGP